MFLKLIHYVFVALLFSSSFIRIVCSSKITPVLKLIEVQRKALKELKSSVIKDLPHEYMKEDGYLLRWLAAKSFNIEETKSQLLENVAWRSAENIDSILEEDFSDLEERIPYDISNVNKNGLPILALQYGKWNLQEEVSTLQGYKKLARYRIKILEEAEKKTRELMKKKLQYKKSENVLEEAPQFDVIDNLEGYSVETHECDICLEFAEDGMNVTKSYYPGAIRNVFFVNSPPEFVETLKDHIHKIPERRKELLKILEGRDSYEPVISQFVDKEEFPKFL